MTMRRGVPTKLQPIRLSSECADPQALCWAPWSRGWGCTSKEVQGGRHALERPPRARSYITASAHIVPLTLPAPGGGIPVTVAQTGCEGAGQLGCLSTATRRLRFSSWVGARDSVRLPLSREAAPPTAWDGLPGGEGFVVFLLLLLLPGVCSEGLGSGTGAPEAWLSTVTD